LRGKVRNILLAASAVLVLLGGVPAARSVPLPGLPKKCNPVENWTLVGTDTFGMPFGLPRSQGVTTDGFGWIFSSTWTLERTSDDYVTMAANTWPADNFSEPQIAPDGTNYLGDFHFGDIDYYNGLIYAPIEDPSEGPINNPEYQHPHIALYDAQTLRYTGVKYALPLDIHAAGVPWVAINAKARNAYTAEWDMPHDRINVFDLKMNFLRFIPLHYAEAFAPGFHLSRIQGAKMLNGALYVTRDDDQKSVFKVDVKTGDVTKVFSIDPPGASELEGLAIRKTPDGALMHVLLVRDNDTGDPQNLVNIRVEFLHYKLDMGCA